MTRKIDSLGAKPPSALKSVQFSALIQSRRRWDIVALFLKLRSLQDIRRAKAWVEFAWCVLSLPQSMILRSLHLARFDKCLPVQPRSGWYICFRLWCLPIFSANASETTFALYHDCWLNRYLGDNEMCNDTNTPFSEGRLYPMWAGWIYRHRAIRDHCFFPNAIWQRAVLWRDQGMCLIASYLNHQLRPMSLCV